MRDFIDFLREHPVLSAFTVLVIIPALVFFLWFFPRLQAQRYLDNHEDTLKKDKEILKQAFDIENANRVTAAQIVAGVALLIGLYFTYQNVKTSQENLKLAHENLEKNTNFAQENLKLAQNNFKLAEQGKITERFGKAVELLGSEKLDIRLGGIYALDRITRDSEVDYLTVMEVLTAFVRGNSPFDSDQANDELIVRRRLSEDIQTVMTVLGRRHRLDNVVQLLDFEKSHLAKAYLKEVNLEGAYLGKSNLYKADFSKAVLTETNFYRAILQKAVFYKANLCKAKLAKTNLCKADLGKADLTEANFYKADLTEASFREADLKDAKLSKADLCRADLSGAKNLTLRQLIKAVNFESAKLPPELKAELEQWRKSAVRSDD